MKWDGRRAFDIGRSQGGSRPSALPLSVRPPGAMKFQPHKVVTEDVNGKKKRKRIPIGDPIPNYFPAVVPEDLFYQVQALFKKNQVQTKNGTPVGLSGNGKMGNLFVHLAKCGYCGASMYVLDKSPGRYYGSSG